jgi:DNA-binding LytR/AlgR family response regulator
MSQYQCLIVDDERAAHLVLQNYIERVAVLTFAQSCYSAIEAINYLHTNEVDIIFLDINMPELTGLEFLATFKNAPRVILTTAYSEFALDAYELGVVDYLLKPIPFPRFLKAINRISEQAAYLPSPAQAAPPSLTTIPDSIFVQVDGTKRRILFTDLKYVQSYGNYVKIYTDKEMYLSPMTTNEIEANLPDTHFVRCHKSYIIALQRIESVSGKELIISDVIIPIGNSFRQMVLSKLK